MYNKKVLDHLEHPRNLGKLKDANGVGVAASPRCNDPVIFYIKISKGCIEEAGFDSDGCGAMVAASSMATEMLKGKSVNEALGITAKHIIQKLGGLPAEKFTCAEICQNAIKCAVEDYYRKNYTADIR